MTTIGQWLTSTSSQFRAAGIDSYRLDALILLSDELTQDKSWLLAHDDYELTKAQTARLDKLAYSRSQRTPLAYIRGFVEFYGRTFSVNPEVLIPRPETEVLIESVLQLELPHNATVIDIGTGSGCIAVTLACERPAWHVYGSDVSRAALQTATKNAASHSASVEFVESHLFTAVSSKFDLICANLPYVAPDYEISTEARQEPALALFSGDKGYELTEQLLSQAASYVNPDGYVVIECDPWQKERLVAYATNYSLRAVQQHPFHVVFART